MKTSKHSTFVKHVVLVVFMVLGSTTVKGQPLDLDWARGLYSSKTSFTTLDIVKVLFDKSGNIYVVGSYQGTMDLDPGTGEEIITSRTEGFAESEMVTFTT